MDSLQDDVLLSDSTLRQANTFSESRLVLHHKDFSSGNESLSLQMTEDTWTVLDQLFGSVSEGVEPSNQNLESAEHHSTNSNHGLLLLANESDNVRKERHRLIEARSRKLQIERLQQLESLIPVSLHSAHPSSNATRQSLLECAADHVQYMQQLSFEYDSWVQSSLEAVLSTLNAIERV